MLRVNPKTQTKREVLINGSRETTIFFFKCDSYKV